MPSSFPPPARSAAPAAAGGAPLPEPRPATAGHTGLPLSVWPGVPGPGCAVPGHDLALCPGPGARLVITAFSRPGDLVAVIPPAACPELAAAVAGTGHRVPGVTSGPPGPATRAADRAPACHGGASPGTASGAGQAALAVTVSCDGLPAGGVNPGQGSPYPAAHHALRPGGLLAVMTGYPAAGGVPDLGLAVARARAAGLVYTQHIILIHAAIDGDQFRPFPAPSGRPPGRIYTDLLIFTKPGSL
jgi:hypothetical protein